jgi:hypothetical protein
MTRQEVVQTIVGLAILLAIVGGLLVASPLTPTASRIVLATFSTIATAFFALWLFGVIRRRNWYRAPSAIIHASAVAGLLLWSVSLLLWSVGGPERQSWRSWSVPVWLLSISGISLLAIGFIGIWFDAGAAHLRQGDRARGAGAIAIGALIALAALLYLPERLARG